ncbi:MFS transporter [Methylobacterium sp. NEAU 140]|nr:MFS transporter [Methylobacterium sp. NEAU 140]MDP4024527.1 MFS transporter [Methylobacterium sp. NEAU 140]
MDRTGDGLWRGGLARVLALYALLYGAYGALSPILPSFLAARGLSASEIGILLAAAGALRIVAGPLAGRIADRSGAARTVLAGSAALAGLATLAHLLGHSFAPLLAASLAYALGTAAPAPVADALALAAARGGQAFQYGWVRAAGSAAFIAATAAAGALIGAAGLAAAVAASGLLFLTTAAAARTVPAEAAGGGDRASWDGVRALVGSARFRRTVLAAALVIGAHALHDGFAVLLWRASGIGPGVAGLLWSGAVASEIVVFLLVGPPLLRRIGLPGGVALAAAAGGLRWSVLALTTALPWLAAAEALHGLSFALLHLACLGLIEASVPRDLRATALAVYGTFGLGLAGVLATLASGWLYGRFGAGAFWAMAVLSLAALPLVPGLRTR